MLSSVVGFVLAVILRKVRGSDKQDEESREGDGDGGELGRSGRTEASSSASNALVGDHIESLFKDNCSEMSS
jgi:hypothetical protein